MIRHGDTEFLLKICWDIEVWLQGFADLNGLHRTHLLTAETGNTALLPEYGTGFAVCCFAEPDNMGRAAFSTLAAAYTF